MCYSVEQESSSGSLSISTTINRFVNTLPSFRAFIRWLLISRGDLRFFVTLQLLMEHLENHEVDDHRIDFTAATGGPESDPDSAALEYRLVPFTKGWLKYGFCRSNSVLWVLGEFVIVASQFTAAILIFRLSRSERSLLALLVWVVGYAAGCVATLPRLCWRFFHRNDGCSPEQVQAHSRQDSDGMLRKSSRHEKCIVAVSPSTFVVECFFIMWFLLGDAWVYARRPYTQDDSISVRFCKGFLAYSSLMLLAIITIRESLIREKETTHKFMLKTRQIGDMSKCSFRSKGKHTTVASSSRERTISAEDAVCCICLVEYVDNDQLQELPCTHIFHMECVELWLQKNPTCPICKKFALFGSKREQLQYGAL